MNVFVLDYDMVQCAEMHVDSHVRKMCVEALQIVSTALYNIDRPLYKSWSCVLYAPAYQHHPIVKWASLDKKRIFAVTSYGYAVAQEYLYRWCKQHSTTNKLRVIKSLLLDYERSLHDVFATMPQAMPDEYKNQSVLTAYRKYYTYAKAHLHQWTNRSVPRFIVESRGRSATVGS